LAGGAGNDIFASDMNQPVDRNLSVSALIQKAETSKQAGDASRVVALYESWIRDNPDDPLLYAVLFNHGVALTEAGNLETARACLERALALNPEFMPAYINLGRVLEQLGQADQAVLRRSAMVDKLAAVNGAAITHKTTALNQIARVLEAGNQDEAAESILRQNIRDPGSEHDQSLPYRSDRQPDPAAGAARRARRVQGGAHHPR
jgi:tetratricopeptide (TPR) repeat protein